MKTASLHFRFSAPGNWGEFVLTALCTDRGGFIQSRRYTPADVPTTQAPALASAVAVIAGMGEDWQAVQVWARLAESCVPAVDDPLRFVEAVRLTVEAVNSQGGRRTFTGGDYPEFIITAPAAVAFFKYFTEQQ